MAGLIALSFPTIWVVMYALRQLGDARRRRAYICALIWLLTLGIALSVIYTLEVESVFGRADLEGDASNYIESANAILAGLGATSAHAVYDYFLAAFLWNGGTFAARIGQLFILICSYSLGIIGLARLGHGQRTITWYSGFICFNGIFYGLTTQLVRDCLIVVCFAMLFVCMASLQGQAKKRKLFVIAMGSIGISLLASLSEWVLFTALLAVVADIAGGFSSSMRSGRGRIVLVVVGLAAIGSVFFQTDELGRLFKINVEDDMARQGFYTAYGIENQRSALDAPKAILGPGLIRPILWHEYFWYSTNAHSGMYWWGTLAWYILLVLAGPSMILQLRRIWASPGARFCATAFVLLVGIYSYAYGSGMGMRKRAIFQFLLLMTIASAGFFEQKGIGGGQWLTGLLSDGRRTLLTMALVVVMVVANVLTL